jgi:hypothetical protein
MVGWICCAATGIKISSCFHLAATCRPSLFPSKNKLLVRGSLPNRRRRREREKTRAGPPVLSVPRSLSRVFTNVEAEIPLRSRYIEFLLSPPSTVMAFVNLWDMRRQQLQQTRPLDGE